MDDVAGRSADYVLEYRNTKLAVVEAKAWDQLLTEGIGQAKDYASKLAVRFTYASNGQGICAIDMQSGAEAEIASYPTPTPARRSAQVHSGSMARPSPSPARRWVWRSRCV